MDTLIEAILENIVRKNRYNACAVSYITTCKILKYIIDNYKKQTYEIYITNNSFETQFMYTLLNVSKRIERMQNHEISPKLNNICTTMHTSWNKCLNEKYLFTIIKYRINDIKKVYYEYLNRAKIDESLMNMSIIHVNSPVLSIRVIDFNGDKFEEIETFLVNNMLTFERNNCENINDIDNESVNETTAEVNETTAEINEMTAEINTTTKQYTKHISGMRRKNPITGEINYAKK